MKLQSGHIYDIASSGHGDVKKFIYVGSTYDGDITGFGNTTYKFISYDKNISNKIELNDIIEYELKCGEKLEDVVGKITLNETIVPYNVKYVKKIVEYYEIEKKKPKIIYE